MAIDVTLANIIRNLPGGKRESFPMLGAVPGEGTVPCEPGKDGHSPYIGDNGSWYVYDDAQQKFVDTGKPSRGEPGQQGVQGVQGPIAVGQSKYLHTPFEFNANAGNGTNNDADAIEQCLAEYGICYLPAGYSWTITRTITVHGRRNRITDLRLVGDGAPYKSWVPPAASSYAIGTFNDTAAGFLEKMYTVVRVKFPADSAEPERYAINIPVNYTDESGQAVTINRVQIDNILFMGAYYKNVGDLGGETLPDNTGYDKIGCIRHEKQITIHNCAFLHFSGNAIYSPSADTQHQYITDCSFAECRTAIKLNSFDHWIRSCWICRCRDGIVFEHDGSWDKYRLSGVWFDQLYGDAIRVSGETQILITDCWCDQINGYFLKAPTSSTKGNLRGFIIGTRINRTNLGSGNASIEAYAADGLYAQIDSAATAEKPLFHFVNSCNHSVFIAPVRTAVVAVNNTLLTAAAKGDNMIWDSTGLLELESERKNAVEVTVGYAPDCYWGTEGTTVEKVTYLGTYKACDPFHILPGQTYTIAIPAGISSKVYPVVIADYAGNMIQNSPRPAAVDVNYTYTFTAPANAFVMYLTAYGAAPTVTVTY